MQYGLQHGWGSVKIASKAQGGIWGFGPIAACGVCEGKDWMLEMIEIEYLKEKWGAT